MFKKSSILLFFVLALIVKNNAQTCSLPGMTPNNAIPVCGTSVFHQDLVTDCTGPDVAHSGCSEIVTSNKSFWYKFTCYQTGTLGFLISGISPTDDYDWILMDITNRKTYDVFWDASLQVSLNIYGTSGRSGAPFPNSPTGCVPSGTGDVHCGGDGAGNSPFNHMPTIIVGHEYLLMVTNWTSGSTQGYDLAFMGGGGSITDPQEPHLQSSRAICDGTQAAIKFNKRMKCNSLSGNGSEFFITPGLSNVIAAQGFGCNTGFDMDSLILTLDKPLPPGPYTITIKNGNDGNTIKDNCDRTVPVNETIPMVVYPVFPTPMDSLVPISCAPDELKLIFRKNMRCNSIAADGSDFRVNLISGTAAVTVAGASGTCSADGLTQIIKVKLAAPLQTKGVYEIQLLTGSDGNTIIDECGQETPAGAAIQFSAKDTVNADFTYNIRLGCKRDTIDYFHDGKNEVNFWKWNFDNSRSSSLQNPSIVYATFGQKTAQLIVSNGVCKDSSAVIPILLDNDLNAAFEATEVVCPGALPLLKITVLERLLPGSGILVMAIPVPCNSHHHKLILTPIV
jgi:PKD repeat protein